VAYLRLQELLLKKLNETGDQEYQRMIDDAGKIYQETKNKLIKKNEKNIS
jgi:hypothetical protein